LKRGVTVLGRNRQQEATRRSKEGGSAALPDSRLFRTGERRIGKSRGGGRLGRRETEQERERGRERNPLGGRKEGSGRGRNGGKTGRGRGRVTERKALAMSLRRQRGKSVR
jgi:hypothetical protein